MIGFLKTQFLLLSLVLLMLATPFAASADHLPDSVTAASGLKAEELLGKGWEAFNAADYPGAEEYFLLAGKLPPNPDEAVYGAALCRLVQGDAEGARKGYRSLVEQHFRLSETLPQYLHLAVDAGAFAEAYTLVDTIDLLSEEERTKPELLKAAIHIAFLRAEQSASLDDDRAFVRSYLGELEACRHQPLFRTTADRLTQGGRAAEAGTIYQKLFHCSADPGERTGLLFVLKGFLTPAELFPLIDAEAAPLPVADPHRIALQGLQKELLYRQLSDEPGRTLEIGEALLAIDPHDGTAHRVLGWHLLQAEEYDASYHHFAEAEHAQGPDAELAEGKVYALSGGGRLKEALEHARSQSDNPRMVEIADQIEARLLWQELQALPDDAEERGPVADAIIKLTPDDPGIRSLRGWWLFNRQRHTEALADFRHILAIIPHDHDAVYGAAMAQRRLGDDDAALDLAKDHGGEDERLGTLVHDILAERGWKAYDAGDPARAKKYAAQLLALDPDDRDGRGILQALQGGEPPDREIPLAYPGYLYLDLYQALKGGGGLGGSLLGHQGIDWLKTGRYSFLNTYLFYRHQTRTSDTRYFDETGGGGGIMIRGRVSKLGLEYAVMEELGTNHRHDGWVAYLEWYVNDLIPRAGKPYEALTWDTYGRIEYDLANRYGLSISSFFRGGIDWYYIAAETPLSTYAEVRFHAREKETDYFNSWGPVVGVEGRRGDLRIGIEHAWLYWTEQNVRENTAGIYIRWYYDWDLVSLRQR